MRSTADYVLTELGGWSIGRPRRSPHGDGERRREGPGLAPTPRPRHAGSRSMPFGADNALIKAAEIVRRLSITGRRRTSTTSGARQVAAMDLPDEIRDGSPRPRRSSPPSSSCRFPWPGCATPKRTRPSRPTSSTAGRRRTPSPTRRHRRRHPHRARARPATTSRPCSATPSATCTSTSTSPSSSTATRPPRRRATTRCGRRVTQHTQVAYPGAELVPGLIVGGTDARFFRERAPSPTAPGCSHRRWTSPTFGTRFHGNDERIDVESLGLSANYFYGIAKDLTG